MTRAALHFLRHPLPTASAAFDEAVRDAFVGAGRDREHIDEVCQRYLARDDLTPADRQVVADYHHAALAKFEVTR